MEFFEFAAISATQEEIRDNVSVSNLPFFCEEVEAVDEAEELGRVIYFRHWGRFHIRRENVMGGVRFSVPDCPNALAWTVTTGYPPHPQKVVLHATINRTEHDPEFITATQELLAAFKNGIEKNFQSKGKHVSAEPLPYRIADLRCKL
jgi:protoporphyrinogen oxidase